MTNDELFILCLIHIRASRREMQEALGRSSGYVTDHLDRLELTGLVVNVAPNKSRVLLLTEAGRTAIAGYTVSRLGDGVLKLTAVAIKENEH